MRASKTLRGSSVCISNARMSGEGPWPPLVPLAILLGCMHGQAARQPDPTGASADTPSPGTASPRSANPDASVGDTAQASQPSTTPASADACDSLTGTITWREAIGLSPEQEIRV